MMCGCCTTRYASPVPIDVNAEERLAQIAEATLRVVEKRGADGVTIRAVAEEMGGSTTVVTNYIPTRTRLISNAVHHAIDAWQEELDGQMEGVAPEDEFRALARWSSSTTSDDPAIRQLFIELLAKAGEGEELEALREDGKEHREHFKVAAAAAGVADPGFAADLMHLILRGFYLAAVEDPEQWSTARVQPVIDHLIDLLQSAPAPARAPAPRRRRARS
jgi:AcrR family transcriptional regulator